jgi:hypothetical protein
MTVLKRIAKEYHHAVTKECSDAGCKLKLSDLKDYVVLKGEAVFKDQPVCDCIIFVNNAISLVGVVELKSKTVDVSKVRQQLTNGLKFAIEVVKKYGVNPEQFRYYVIVMAKKWRKSELDVIKSKSRRIEFQGKKYPILTKRCGISFSYIVSRF